MYEAQMYEEFKLLKTNVMPITKYRLYISEHLESEDEGSMILEEGRDCIAISNEKGCMVVRKDLIKALYYECGKTDISMEARCPHCKKSLVSIPPVLDWTCSCGCRIIFPKSNLEE